MTSVLDAIRIHRDQPDAIIAAGELVDMRFRNGNSLSLRAAKLFCMLVQEAGVAVIEDVQHRIPYSVLNETFHKSRDDLADAIEELHSTIISVKVTSRNGRDYVKSGPILSDVERESDDLSAAEIRFEFSPTMRRMIASSTHWAAVSRRAVLAFESKYSLRLYLFLSLRARLRKTGEDFTLDDLREILGLKPGTLTRWQDLRRFALEPAVAEISHLAGFHAAYMPIKRGRKIGVVRLVWGLKDPAELIAAQKELDQPRTGRIARREGLVETVAQERHRIAESLASVLPLDQPRSDHVSRTRPIIEKP